MTPKKEIYISVDVESTGAYAGFYSMFQIGACLVFDDPHNFYREIKVLNKNFDPESLDACGVTIESLLKRGVSPILAMNDFTKWIQSISYSEIPVCVCFNAPFDWQFINYYFRRFVGVNPFGHKALDACGYYMGMMNSTFGETSMSEIDQRFLSSKPHTHNALDDARQQADMFQKMFEFNQRRQGNS